MGDKTIVIGSVEVIRGDDTRDPDARKAIERLFTKWLVRAPEPYTQSPDSP